MLSLLCVQDSAPLLGRSLVALVACSLHAAGFQPWLALSPSHGPLSVLSALWLGRLFGRLVGVLGVNWFASTIHRLRVVGKLMGKL